MKTYLVEAYRPGIEFDKDSIVVALTPKVCYQLDKAGVKYSIIEDYYDEVALLSQSEAHRLSVFRWIDDWDDFLQNNIKGLDLKLGTIYRWYLKGMILDPLYIRCYTLKRLFDAIKPVEVTYILPKPDEPHLNYRFEYYGRSLYAQVIPILCREKSIPLTPVFLEPDGKEVKEIKSINQGESLITRLKKSLYKSGAIRRMYFTYRCAKKLPYLKRAKHKKLNIFLLMISHIGEDFVAESLIKGHHIFLSSGDDILKYSCFGTKRYLNVKAGSAPLNNSFWDNTANLLAGHSLVKWVNEKCQLDVSEIVLPKLRHFVSRVCPELVVYNKAYMEFYKNNRIDVLMTPSTSSLQDYAALAATKNDAQVKTVCLYHGDEVYEEPTWNIGELQNFHVHISSHAETREYIQRLANEIHSPTKVYSSPHRLLNVKKIADLREKKGNRIIRKNRIIYLPTFMKWDTRRMGGGHPYADTWYYQLQKSFIAYFSTRGEYTFVWKGLPQSDDIFNPIPDFIRDNRFSNIEIATNPFVEHLLTADRVICDSPSTGFYESVVADVPVMSLYHTSAIVRRGAVEYFGNLLKLFSDTPEAIKHIDDFLNSDPEQYKMRIDMEGGSLFDSIEGNDRNKLGFNQ